MFDNISRYVVGPWYYNAIDSEALIFLDLLDNKLASYLSAIEAGSTIEGIVIGIKSLYQSCYRCGNLMQGFQRAMHQRLQRLAQSYKIAILDHARSVIIVDGTLMPHQPVKMFMRSNRHVPTINSKQDDPRYQFRLLIKE